MFKEAQQQLAQRYKQLEQDQNDIRNKLQTYKEYAQMQQSQELSLLIEDQDSTLLVLSNTHRELDSKLIQELQMKVAQLEEEGQLKSQIINELKTQNLKLQASQDNFKRSVLQTHKIMEEISQQRDTLLGELKRIKQQDISIIQTSVTDITRDVDGSTFVGRKKSSSTYEGGQQQLKHYERFINSIRDMMMKLQPNVYKDFLKALLEMDQDHHK